MSLNSVFSRFVVSALLVIGVLLMTSCVAAPLPTSAPAAASPTAATVATAPVTVSPTATTAPTEPASSPTAVAAPASNTPLEGRWEGKIEVAGQTIGIIVRFEGTAADLKAWLDIPDQAVTDSVLNKVSFDGKTVHFEALGGGRNIIMEGQLEGDSITGTFQQSTYTGTFSLTRASAIVAVPTASVPYKQEEVTFKNGNVTLAGTLTLPPTGGPFPVVVLISGSGPQNRDEEIFGFKPFAMIADHFTRNGIAVLRYDDRGVAGSTGDSTTATTEDFAADVQAAVDMLKTRRDIKAHQIGLLGHSEGGIIAPMVASRSQDIAFVITLAGTGVTGEQILERQVVDVLLSSGGTQADADKALAEQRKTMEAVKTGKGLDELQASWRETTRKQIEALPEAQRKALGDVDVAVEDAVKAQLDAITSPWFKYFLTYDPAPALAKVRVPVLALFGGKDVQVAAEPNLEAMKAAFEKGGNNQVTFKTYPEANHLFQPALTGSPNEYATLKEFVPGLLDDMAKWIGETLAAQ